MRIAFVVLGKPVPQGSKRWLPAGRMIEANNKELRPWRQAVTAAAVTARTDNNFTALTGPVEVRLQFRFTRPKSHYGTGRNAGKLKPSAPRYVSVMPDLDKITRGILDGVTDAGLWIDDAQVVRLIAEKEYGEQAGVIVTLGEAL
jgi:crossover junction endodeoxyribonuclease RusA